MRAVSSADQHGRHVEQKIWAVPPFQKRNSSLSVAPLVGLNLDAEMQRNRSFSSLTLRSLPAKEEYFSRCNEAVASKSHSTSTRGKRAVVLRYLHCRSHSRKRADPSRIAPADEACYHLKVALLGRIGDVRTHSGYKLRRLNGLEGLPLAEKLRIAPRSLYLL